MATEPSALPVSLHGAYAIDLRTIEARLGEAELGPASSWPAVLRATVRTMLESAMPAAVLWGPEHLQIYNDGFAQLIGDRSPAALGRPVRAAWPEFWAQVEPELGRVHRGDSSVGVDRPVVFNRRGFDEETYFRYSHSPLRDDADVIVGSYVAAIETTVDVLARRRLNVLWELAAIAGNDVDALCGEALRVLAEDAADVPFALVFMLEGEARLPRLVAAGGVRAEGDAQRAALEALTAPTSWPLDWPAESVEPVVITDLRERHPDLAAGPWPESPSTALVLPLRSNETVNGAVVLGASPRLELDGEYTNFLTMAANQIATSVGAATNLNADRERAGNLEQALETSRQIGAATGILMNMYKITGAEAFQLLRMSSQNTNQKLRDVADTVVQTGVVPVPPRRTRPSPPR